MPEPSPPPGPAPIAATFVPPVGALQVTFDQALTPGPSLAANWSGRFLNRVWVPFTIPSAAGTTVTFQVTLGAAQVGPDVVNYAATPPDVTALATGIPAPPFADFPIT